MSLSIFRAATLALAIGAAGALVSPAAHADRDPVYTGLFNNNAAGGYDVVAYFSDGAPTQGSSSFKTTYNGANFLFASQANLDAFLADPVKYAPQYGGYCAWAVSQGYVAKGNPQNWSVVDGKLYLNFNQNVQNDWNADRAKFITDADANWPSVLQ